MLHSSLATILADTLADGGWRAKARPSQLPPGGAWNGWLVMAGRGFGKTRTGAEWVKEQVESGDAKRIAMVAPTASDARDVMTEGESGILSISSDWCRPVYEPSKRRLTWPNGAIASTFSSEEADRLRGPQFDLAWADELAAWNDPVAAWSMLQFGLRLGWARRPRGGNCPGGGLAMLGVGPGVGKPPGGEPPPAAAPPNFDREFPAPGGGGGVSPPRPPVQDPPPPCPAVPGRD